MNKALFALAFSSAAMVASPASAVVTINDVVPANGVDYTFFSFTGGALSIGTVGSGATPLTDPMIALFTDNGSQLGALTGTLIGTDDDGGGGLNALLQLSSLSAGNYVLAVGSYNLLEGEARSGIANTPGVAEGYTTTFTSRTDVSIGRAVPEPGTWMTMLVGFALAGAALRGRRRSATSPKAFGLT